MHGDHCNRFWRQPEHQLPALAHAVESHRPDCVWMLERVVGIHGLGREHLPTGGMRTHAVQLRLYRDFMVRVEIHQRQVNRA